MRTALTVALLAVLALPVQAAEMLPGLWEFSSEDMEVDGMQMPGMAEMLEQMQALPPEQQAMMKEMLAEQGLQMSETGVRMCLSQAQIEARELPFQDEPGCTQEITEQTDDRWRFRFECPDAKGSGETRLVSDREVRSTIESEYRVGDQQGTSRMASHGRWLGTDCGELEPRS